TRLDDRSYAKATSRRCAHLLAPPVPESPSCGPCFRRPQREARAARPVSGPARRACAAPAPGAQSLRCERESPPRDESRTSRLCPSLAIHHVPESCGHRFQRIGLEDDKIEALGEKISPFLERPGIVAAVQPGEQPRDGSTLRQHQLQYMDVAVGCKERAQVRQDAPNCRCINMVEEAVHQDKVESAVPGHVVRSDVCYHKVSRKFLPGIRNVTGI